MRTINPATGDVIWEGVEATPKDIDNAINSASQEWRNLTVDERYQYLIRYQKRLSENREKLAEAISKEVGKPLWESKSEVDAMIAKIPISYEAFQERCRHVETTVSQGQSIRRHKPRGLVAVFGPFNFPGHLPNGHIVPALLAGNTILFKPSEQACLVANEMLRCFEDLPQGVLQLVLGGKNVGQILSNHPKIDALFFTGSVETGLILLKDGAPHPEKILALELGGNNPLVVSSVEEKKWAAYIALQSAFLTSGQRCTSARRLIVLRKEQEVVHHLVEMAKKVKIGPYTDLPEPFMGPLISEEAAKKVIEAQNSLIEAGAKPLLVAKRDNAFVSCGIVDTTSIRLPDSEIFGPLLQVIFVDNLAEAIKEANDTKFGLSASILTDQDDEYALFYKENKAGVINRNCPTNGALSSNPFGGTGLSGNGRPSAYYAADYCSYPVASIESAKVTSPKNPLPGVTL